MLSEELNRKTPPVASPPASVEEIANTVVDHVVAEWVYFHSPKERKALWDIASREIKAAILSDRAAMAERVAGLQLEIADYCVESIEAGTALRASEAEVARLREALEPFAERASQYDDRRGGYTVSILVDMLRKARAALTRPDEPTKET